MLENKQKPPERLFRYMGTNGIIPTLVTQNLRFSSPSLFDDKSECSYKYVRASGKMIEKKSRDKDFLNTASLEFLVNMKTRPGKSKRIMRSVSRKENSINLKEELKRRLRICCFTKRNNNVRMWDEYAKNGKSGAKRSGALLEFDSRDFKNLYQVRYSDTLPHYNDAMCYEEGIHFYEIMSHKRLKYSFEEEWRYILSIEAPNHLSCDKLDAEENLHIYFNAIELKNVYLGSNISTSSEQEILTILEDPKYSHVGIYKLKEGDDISFLTLREGKNTN